MIPTIPAIEDLTHEDIGPHPAGWIPGLPFDIPGVGLPVPGGVDVPGTIRRAVGIPELPDIDWPKVGRFAVVSGVLIVGLLGLIVPESGLSVDDLKGLVAKGAEVAA